MKRYLFSLPMILGLVLGPTAAAGEVQMMPLPEGTLYYSACLKGQGRVYDECTETTTIPGTETEVPPEVFALTSDATTQVTDNDLYEFWNSAWSPSDDRFVVSGDPDANYEQCRAYVIAVADGSAHPISRDDEWECAGPVDWSSDGRWILTNVHSFEVGSQLYKVRPDGSDAKALTAFGEGFEVYDARFIDHGRAIVYWGDTSKGRGIFVMTAEGRYLYTIVRLKAKGPDRRFMETVAVAPNHRLVAYAIHDGDHGHSPGDGLYTVRIDGTHRRHLSSGRIDKTALSWGPGSQRLAVVKGSMYRSDPPISIKVIRPGTDAVTRVELPTTGRIYRWDPPLWSPSGDHLAFSVEDLEGGKAAYVANSRTGKIAQVTEFDYPFDLFSWNP